MVTLTFWLIAASCDDGGPRATGPTPYVRCLAGHVPKSRSFRIGRIALDARERTLTLSKRETPLLFAVFSGAGLGDAPRAAALESLRHSDADVLLMLGGLGDSEATAIATAKLLATLQRPVLFVPGGRDAPRTVHAAIEQLGEQPSVIDISVFRQVRLGDDTLIPVAGAEAGRYAIDDTRCGFGAEDLSNALTELGAAKLTERRWLVSWHVPAASNAADSGSARLAGFAAKSGVRGAFSAWPVEPQTVGALITTRVPRLFGPRLERKDGSRLDLGWLMLEASPDGLHERR
jgi:hypothetical protein